MFKRRLTFFSHQRSDLQSYSKKHLKPHGLDHKKYYLGGSPDIPLSSELKKILRLRPKNKVLKLDKFVPAFL